MSRSNIQKLIEEKQGINLDVGCGANKNSGFVGLDILDLPEVDIVWDFNRTPWPLPDECVLKAVASHVLEHILPTYETARLEPLVQLLISKGIFSQEEADSELGKPSRGFLGFMDELWRVMKPSSQFAFVVPYGGNELYNQDPTHVCPINAQSLYYFDPDPELKYAGLALYLFYQPKPWKIEFMAYHTNGLLECILSKRLDDPSYHNTKPEDITQEFKNVPPHLIK